jgi:hypothetical protein
VAKQDLGGAKAWATVVSASGIGAIVGGVVAMRVRTSRPLATSCVAALPYGAQLLAFGLRAPLWALVVVAVFAGASLAVHIALWFTVFQREVPEAARSRVSSYDALGSFVLIPLGAALAGPFAAAVGLHAAMVAAGAVTMGCNVAVLAVPSIWAIGRGTAEPVPA